MLLWELGSTVQSVKAFKEILPFSNSSFLLKRSRLRRWNDGIKPVYQLGFLNLWAPCQNNKTEASHNPSTLKHLFLIASLGFQKRQLPQKLPRHAVETLCYWNISLFSFLGVSFNSVYTQIWRVLLHLAADPYPDVSDLAMKVLNSIAYKVCVTRCSQWSSQVLGFWFWIFKRGNSRCLQVYVMV